MSENSTKWQELVYRGVESDELDYKAAQDWEELTKAGKAKFVRHLLAFANTRGGYLVVGVGEDASGYPALRTGLTAKQCASFDPSKVGAFVNSHVEPPIKFTIERPLIKGKRYAILSFIPSNLCRTSAPTAWTGNFRRACSISALPMPPAVRQGGRWSLPISSAVP